MVERITAVINELEKDIALSEGLGDSRENTRFRALVLLAQHAVAPSDPSLRSVRSDATSMVRFCVT